MVNPVHYMKFLKRFVFFTRFGRAERFVFVSNDYETDVYVNHNRDITSETAKVRVQLHNMPTVRVRVRHNKAIICND